MTLEEYLGDWIKVINRERLREILITLEKEYKIKRITPQQSNIFKAFNLCPLKDLKVIMLFQDPYPQKDVCTGIAVANNKEGDDISPSLSILKEIVINNTVPHYGIKFDNSLESWEKQGVLMLNSALTTEINKIGSHINLWRPFISSLFENLSLINPGLIYVLYGETAQTFIPYIKNSYIIKTPHPAYYYHAKVPLPYNLFNEIDNLVKRQYNTQIKWFEEYE